LQVLQESGQKVGKETPVNSEPHWIPILAACFSIQGKKTEKYPQITLMAQMKS